MKYEDFLLAQTRRQFFSRSARGIGSLALAGLLNRVAEASTKVGSAPYDAATRRRRRRISAT